jgi:hypothetical protein
MAFSGRIALRGLARTLMVTMRARGSTGASAMRWSTPTGAASCSNRIRRASRIATAADRFCESRSASSRSFSASSPTADMQGEKVTTATLIAVEIVRKNYDQIGFALNPRRWVVERFFTWIGRNRRLAKDFEATIDSARAFLYAASVMPSCVGLPVLHDFRN